jgi:WXG100 family type VII secretion target
MIMQMVRAATEGVVSQAMQQAKAAEELLGTINGYIPKVQSAWRGGDEQEFEADVKRKLVPAMMQLIAAIAGFGGNLTKSMGVMDQADNKIKSLADGLGDVFKKIF